MTLTIEAIVESGLCIGCGLCRSLAGDSIELVLTPEGRDRPMVRSPLDEATLARVNAVCPGVRVEGARPQTLSATAEHDRIWGPAERLAVAYASDPAVRFQASSGGVLTALGQYLLASGEVSFVLHVAGSKRSPIRTERRLSFDAAAVLEGAGSRYGPAAPLIDFTEILDRDQPFALIAKPCDIAAVRNLARLDPRVDRLMRYGLSFLCGGASDLTKTEEICTDFGVAPDAVSLFRYRGHGSPGLARLESRDGRGFELTYQAMWEQESKWRLQPRCKICPDSIGESADLVACDLWPGGGPMGEDDGFNGVIVRTRRGRELFEAACAAGAITLDSRSLGFRDLDGFQPHQVRKKRAVWARLTGMQAAGCAVLETHNLRLEDCARLNDLRDNLAEARGARRRARAGRLGEPPARARQTTSLLSPV
jgi:coenzyme F420 hydrogenase subunit beta